MVSYLLIYFDNVHFSFKGGMTCPDCYDEVCVDEHGIIRPLGISWMPNGCFQCECAAGQEISCRALPVACEPQPSPSCVKIPGPCCPKWDCVLDL